MNDCTICAERADLRRTAPAGHRSLLEHTQFGQLAWELVIYREDNSDEWKELRRLTRG